VSEDPTLWKDSLGGLYLLKFENPEGRSPENDDSRRCEGGHVAPDLELWEKVEEEKSEDPEEISIIDRGGS
jgi:hypothetical protein